ncbi:flavodoxin domain-containing protein [Sneathiella sp. HT1-7]|uniref:flavodoxin domain-containing protein n=1 Tax=Sneathiella sp. HT1-7 TaxID=2887192 RepID=UPI001D14E49C|nr:flavodoxin domain-containing protein [Sneathiella sp. HT1-7]MCC3306580.1 flavodoxin domain-containing protein [Sneathiella sp. HT1-7]
MAEQIKILVSTMTGTAELVAEEIADALSAKGEDAEILMMDDLNADILNSTTAYIICTSTYGQGDIPDNGQAFVDNLSVAAPDLSGIKYGVFALGDLTYNQTFCNAGNLFDAAFKKYGAVLVGEIMRHDASSGELPEDQAGEWAENWLELLKAA